MAYADFSHTFTQHDHLKGKGRIIDYKNEEGNDGGGRKEDDNDTNERWT